MLALRDRTTDIALEVPGLARVPKNDDRFLRQVPGGAIPDETDEASDNQAATHRSRSAIQSLRNIIRIRHRNLGAGLRAES